MSVFNYRGLNLVGGQQGAARSQVHLEAGLIESRTELEINWTAGEHSKGVSVLGAEQKFLDRGQAVTSRRAVLKGGPSCSSSAN